MGDKDMYMLEDNVGQAQGGSCGLEEFPRCQGKREEDRLLAFLRCWTIGSNFRFS